MFSLDSDWWELIARAALTYAALLVLMRVSGRRTVGQFTPFDLLVVMLLPSWIPRYHAERDTGMRLRTSGRRYSTRGACRSTAAVGCAWRMPDMMCSRFSQIRAGNLLKFAQPVSWTNRGENCKFTASR